MRYAAVNVLIDRRIHRDQGCIQKMELGGEGEEVRLSGIRGQWVTVCLWHMAS